MRILALGMRSRDLHGGLEDRAAGRRVGLAGCLDLMQAFRHRLLVQLDGNRVLIGQRVARLVRRRSIRTPPAQRSLPPTIPASAGTQPSVTRTTVAMNPGAAPRIDASRLPAIGGAMMGCEGAPPVANCDELWRRSSELRDVRPGVFDLGTSRCVRSDLLEQLRVVRPSLVALAGQLCGASCAVDVAEATRVASL